MEEGRALAEACDRLRSRSRTAHWQKDTVEWTLSKLNRQIRMPFASSEAGSNPRSTGSVRHRPFAGGRSRAKRSRFHEASCASSLRMRRLVLVLFGGCSARVAVPDLPRVCGRRIALSTQSGQSPAALDFDERRDPTGGAYIESNPR